MMRSDLPRRAVPLLFVMALGVAACASGDGAAEDEGSAAVTSEAASAVAACEPVGEGGGTPVAVTLQEYTVAAEPAEVGAGSVTFEIENAGSIDHELVVVQADSIDELPVADDGRVDEEELPEGAFIGEVEGFPAGESCEGTFDLAAGDYVLFCNIVQDDVSHFEEGMATEFPVS